MVCLSRPYQLKLFKGCLPKIYFQSTLKYLSPIYSSLIGTFNDFQHHLTFICPIHEGRIMDNTLKYFLESIVLQRLCERIKRDGNQFTTFVRTHRNGDFMEGKKYLVRKIFAGKAFSSSCYSFTLAIATSAITVQVHIHQLSLI